MKSLLVHMNLKVGFAAGIILVVVTTLTIVSLRNEKNVTETETIRNAMKDQAIVPVKADWTRRDDAISRWLKEYGKAGVPFYLFIDAKGNAHPLPEVLTTGILLDAFKK